MTREKKASDSLLGRLDALRVLRADDEAEKGVLLEELAELEELEELGVAERDIARELLGVRPLAQPDRFEEAHRSVIRALEVLERNGGRRATVTGLGPLNSPACFVVTLVAGWIARQHRFALVRQPGRLCEHELRLARAPNAAAGPRPGGFARRRRPASTSSRPSRELKLRLTFSPECPLGVCRLNGQERSVWSQALGRRCSTH